MKIEEIVQKEMSLWNDPAFVIHDKSELNKLAQIVKKRGFYHINNEIIFRQNEFFTVRQHGRPFEPIPGIDSLPHNHAYFELVYIYEGKGLNAFHNEKISLKKGDLLFLNPNICHDFYTVGSGSFAFNYCFSMELMNTILQPFLMDNYLFLQFFSNYQNQEGTLKNYLYFSHAALPDFLYTLLNEMVEEYYTKTLGYRHMISGKLILLLTSLMRAYNQSHLGTTIPTSREILAGKLLQTIRSECSTITLEQLSARYSYSARYIQKLLFDITGQNFSDIVRKYRLDKIRILLDTTAMPIADMVEISGFNDLSYLSKVFKKEYGITPAQYRKHK